MIWRRRSVRVLAILLFLVALALVAYTWLRRARAPEAVRLLPEADAVVFFDVENMRRLGAFSGAPVPRDPEYEDFVRETGFQFERDLDAAAFAVHAGRTLPQAGAMQALPADTRFSEIFIGHFDAARAVAYLRKQASSIERYRDLDIYVIPHEGREVKVAILGLDRVAVSNTESREPIHRMVDRYRSGAMHATGPTLVRSYRERVPLGSVVWAIARIGDGTNGGVPAPAFIASLADTIVIASVRPLLGAQLRIEAIAGDSDQAKSIVDTGGTMLALFKDLETNSSPSGSDEDVKNLFASIKVEQHDSSAVLSATIPPGFFKKVTNEPPPLTTATPTPSPSPTPAPPRKKEK